jgi:hypothetical protein
MQTAMGNGRYVDFVIKCNSTHELYFSKTGYRANVGSLNDFKENVPDSCTAYVCVPSVIMFLVFISVH